LIGFATIVRHLLFLNPHHDDVRYPVRYVTGGQPFSDSGYLLLKPLVVPPLLYQLPIKLSYLPGELRLRQFVLMWPVLPVKSLLTQRGARRIVHGIRR
jgi:hypothetical protein